MQIVTDRGADLTPEQLSQLNFVHYAPMRLTLDGKTYSSGVDITEDEFYRLMDESPNFPTTSQATAGDIAAMYREIAAQGEEILSIHISSGLSGTMQSAKAAAEMVPEAKVTFWDTLTLSCPEGWQVQAAAQAILAGWPLERITALLKQVRARTVGMFTLNTLKYLIHGGRISHLKGLLASILQIRPVITVEQVEGKYQTLAQERTIKRALQTMAEKLLVSFPEGSALRVQLLHARNLEAVEQLREFVSARFVCTFEPVARVSPILGAHAGPSLVGLSAGPLDLYQQIG